MSYYGINMIQSYMHLKLTIRIPGQSLLTVKRGNVKLPSLGNLRDSLNSIATACNDISSKKTGLKLTNRIAVYSRQSLFSGNV